MKITEQIVEEMGFEKIKGSSNPTYYKLKFARTKTPIVIGYEGNEDQWSLRRFAGDTLELEHSLHSVAGLVSSVAKKSWKNGSVHKAKQVRKILEIS